MTAKTSSASLFMSMFEKQPQQPSGLVDPTTILPLDAEFPTFSMAVHSYMNAAGYGDTNKGFDDSMIRAFCAVLNVPYFVMNSDKAMRDREFFPTTLWLESFIESNDFFKYLPNVWFRTDHHNRPIAMINIEKSRQHNVIVQFAGAEDIGRALFDLCKENVSAMPVDDDSTKKPVHYINFEGIDGDGDPDYSKQEIHREGALFEEYYPYIDGGIKNLLLDFLASDETVLILMGPPGTGKSSALMYAVEELNLLPIYASKTDVVCHPAFVSNLFSINDRYLDQMDSSQASKQAHEFVESHIFEENDKYHGKFIDATKEANGEDKKAQPIPMVVIEDQDILLRPRTEGNAIMGQLLNELDGVGSNSARKLAITTNLTTIEEIEPALLRDGRCFEVIQFRNLTPDEAVAARKTAGLPDFEVVPTKSIPLATALRKPRRQYIVDNGEVKYGILTK